jgi:hypothetical protein
MRQQIVTENTEFTEERFQNANCDCIDNVSLLHDVEESFSEALPRFQNANFKLNSDGNIFATGRPFIFSRRLSLCSLCSLWLVFATLLGGYARGGIDRRYAI